MSVKHSFLFPSRFNLTLTTHLNTSNTSWYLHWYVFSAFCILVPEPACLWDFPEARNTKRTVSGLIIYVNTIRWCSKYDFLVDLTFKFHSVRTYKPPQKWSQGQNPYCSTYTASTEYLHQHITLVCVFTLCICIFICICAKHICMRVYSLYIFVFLFVFVYSIFVYLFSLCIEQIWRALR